MKSFLKRYYLSFILLLITGILCIFSKDFGFSVLKKAGNAGYQAFIVFPPIMILIGLMDVWVEKETMVKFMGEKSGLKGTMIAFLIGSVAAGPLFVAFPITVMLLKKGASWFNVFVFIGAWSTTKIPMLLFEISSMGLKFALLRLVFDIIAIVLIAWFIDKTTKRVEKQKICEDIE